MKSLGEGLGDEIELYLRRSKHHRSVSSDSSQASYCLLVLTGAR